MDEIKINKLYPTQLSVGYEQVNEKLEKLKSKNKHKLDIYLKEHIVPVILGTDDKFYIIDHHHLCFAAIKHNINKVYIKVIEDWSKLSNKDFWKKMYENKYIWLYDEYGNNIELENFCNLLPNKIKDLKNDPYRSLAGIIRKRGYYEKDWTPFSEFQWANYFRENGIILDYNKIVISEEIINQAIELTIKKNK
jgi:hypothetical protein